MIRERLQKIQVKRLVILNLPYFFIFYVADKGSWLYRHCLGEGYVGGVRRTAGLYEHCPFHG